MNDRDFRASQLEHDQDEEVFIKMDEIAQKDWWVSLDNNGGKYARRATSIRLW